MADGGRGEHGDLGMDALWVGGTLWAGEGVNISGCGGGMRYDWMLEGRQKATAGMPGTIISAEDLILCLRHKPAGFFFYKCPKQMAPGRKGY